MALTDSCADPAQLSPPSAYASCEESLQVVTSPCCWRDHPDVISANPSLVAWTPVTAVRGVHLPVSSSTSSAFPPYTIEVGFPAFAHQNDFLTDPFFETAVISLCSGPQVCSPPRSFPPQWLIASGRPGLLSEQNMLRFLRMHRILLTIRIQAIDGVGTYTPQDSQPCRLLQCKWVFSPTTG